jgi:hypothetical protein
LLEGRIETRRSDEARSLRARLELGAGSAKETQNKASTPATAFTQGSRERQQRSN